MSEFPGYFPTVEQVKINTLFKDEQTALGALETLLWLEQGAPHKFDGLEGDYKFNMGNFVGKLSCGTTCCIAGAIHLFTKGGVNHIVGNSLSPQDLDYYFKLGPANLFSPKREMIELSDLFYVRRDNKEILRNGVYLEMESITPKQAGVVLLNYLKTGVTDWELIGAIDTNTDD